MSEMQCSTSLKHTVTIQFTRLTGSPFFFIPFLPLFPKKYQLKTSAIGNLTALGSSSENKTKLYKSAQTPFATYSPKEKHRRCLFFESLIPPFKKNQPYK